MLNKQIVEGDRANIMIKIMTNGNPGAMTAFFSMVKANKDDILKYCAEHQIFGTNLYVLWSDICNKDLDYMSYLIKNAKTIDVFRFSHMQDYSGKHYFSGILEQYESIN